MRRRAVRRNEQADRSSEVASLSLVVGAEPMCQHPPVQSTIDIIQAHQANILLDWERTIRYLPVARDLPHSVLLDRFPQLLDRIIATVKELTEGRPAMMDDSPAIHALD